MDYLENFTSIIAARNTIRKAWRDLDNEEFVSVSELLQVIELKNKLYNLFADTNSAIRLL